MNRPYFEVMKIYKEAAEELDRKYKEIDEIREQVLAQIRRLRTEFFLPVE